MPHSIRYDTETGIVEIAARGNVTLAEIKEIYSEGLDLAKRNESCLFFSDYRGASLALSTAEIYGLPKLFAEMTALLGVDPHSLKRAIIPSDDASSFRFFETVSSNRGQILARLFHDAEEAKRWLSES